MKIMEGGVAFWHDTLGCNVIPANTKEKRTHIQWKPYQDEEISQEQINLWLSQDAFDNGMAVVLGKIWHGKFKDKYISVVDCDNQLAIDEFCTRNGHKIALETFAQKLIVEQHEDDKTKAHIYIISEKPLPMKASNAGENVPHFEVKVKGNIIYCSPSPHAKGTRYEIMGTREPMVFTGPQTNDFINFIDGICRKYGISYIETVQHETFATKMLFNPNFKVEAGANRHIYALGLARHLVNHFSGSLMSENLLREMWERRCNEVFGIPLPKEEMDHQWNCALRYAEKDIENIKTVDIPKIKRQLSHTDISKEVIIEGAIHSISALMAVDTGQMYKCRDCNKLYEDKRKICSQCKSENRIVPHRGETETRDHRFLEITIPKTSTSEELIIPISLWDSLALKMYVLNDTVRVTGDVASAENREKGIVQGMKETFYYIEVRLIEPTVEKKIEQELTNEDRIELRKWAEETPQVMEELVAKFSPEVVNMDLVKESILLQLVGAETNNIELRRPSLHIMLIGDPSEAKTVLGLSAVNIVKGVYTSGEGVTKAGLVVGITKSKYTGGYVTEPGIAIIGNNKFKLLDEIDKMDKTYVYQLQTVLENEFFKLDKVVHQEYETKGPWLCIGNPVNGKYDDSLSPAENLGFKNMPYFLSRFDLVFIIKKNYSDESLDAKLNAMATLLTNGKFMEEGHKFLGKYLKLVSEHKNITISQEVIAKIKKGFKKIVKMSQFGGIPATERQFWSVIKLAVARAKIQLENEVTVADADRALEIMSGMLMMNGCKPEDTNEMNAFLQSILNENEKEKDLNMKDEKQDI